MPYQPPPPGNNQNPGPPILPGLIPSRSDSEDSFYGPPVPPATPPLRSPHGDPDFSHRFFNPNPGPNYSYNQKEFKYGDPHDQSTLTRVRWYYTRGRREHVYDWETPLFVFNPYNQGGHFEPNEVYNYLPSNGILHNFHQFQNHQLLPGQGNCL